MRLSALMASLTLVALLFAGCSGDGGGEGDATSTSSSSSRSGSATASSTSAGSSSGSASSTSGAPAGGSNGPPTASLSASVNGLAAVFSINGSDPDGDELSWVLDFGDGANTTGTELPATVDHTYAEGEFVANLTVSDGELTAARDVSVTITVDDGGAGGPGQSASLVWDVGVTDQESASQGPSYIDCVDGPNKTFNYDSFTLDPATPGLPFKATITDVSGGAAITSWTLYFNLPDCSDYAATFSADGAGEITGTVPENAGPFTLAMATGGFLLEVTYTSGSQVV